MSTVVHRADILPSKWVWPRSTAKGRFWIVLLLVVALGLAGWNWSSRGAQGHAAISQAVWQEVERSDLEVVVLERGNLESQSNIEIICEVEDVRKDNINGTTILWMIPNGASVKEGDLVVELDANPMQEALDDQILFTENALAEKIQAEANLKNQLTMNATAKAEAELLIRLAELELECTPTKRMAPTSWRWTPTKEGSMMSTTRFWRLRQPWSFAEKNNGAFRLYST